MEIEVYVYLVIFFFINELKYQDIYKYVFTLISCYSFCRLYYVVFLDFSYSQKIDKTEITLFSASQSTR